MKKYAMSLFASTVATTVAMVCLVAPATPASAFVLCPQARFCPEVSATYAPPIYPIRGGCNFCGPPIVFAS
jgi:hypothetical protein